MNDEGSPDDDNCLVCDSASNAIRIVAGDYHLTLKHTSVLFTSLPAV